MRFKSHQHLKMAVLLERQAELSREKAEKQASMAKVFRVLARRAALKETDVETTMPVVLIDPPGPFEPIEKWEQFLAELKEMPEFLGKEGIVKEAELLIAKGKH